VKGKNRGKKSCGQKTQPFKEKRLPVALISVEVLLFRAVKHGVTRGKQGASATKKKSKTRRGRRGPGTPIKECLLKDSRRGRERGAGREGLGP